MTASFQYSARDQAGKLQRGVIEAASPFEAREGLRRLGLRPESVAESRKRAKPGAAVRKSGYRSFRDRAAVLDGIGDLHTLLVAAVPLREALGIIAEQGKSGYATQVFFAMHERVSGGLSFAKALQVSAHPFDSMLIAMVESSEWSGRLEEVLEEYLAIQLRWRALKSKVTGALIYPVIVVLTSVIVVGFLTGYVLPPIVDMLLDTGRELPWSTRVVITISDMVTGWWWLMLGASLLLLLAWKRIGRVGRIHLAKERLLLRIPVLGRLVVEQQLAYMCSLLHGLLKSGLPLTNALKLTKDSVTLLHIQQDLESSIQSIVTGVSPQDALKECSVIPTVISHVFVVSNSPDRVEHLLSTLSSEYDRKVEQTLQRLMAAFEPMMILVLASAVGFVAFSVLLPIMEVGHVQ